MPTSVEAKTSSQAASRGAPSRNNALQPVSRSHCGLRQRSGIVPRSWPATLHSVNDELETLLANVSRREPASADALARLPVELGIPLPDDYAAFMKASNGGEGEVGSAWIEIWPVERVGDDPDASPHYQGVVLFA